MTAPKPMTVGERARYFMVNTPNMTDPIASLAAEFSALKREVLERAAKDCELRAEICDALANGEFGDEYAGVRADTLRERAAAIRALGTGGE